MMTSRPASAARSAACSSMTPSCSQTARAPIAIASSTAIRGDVVYWNRRLVQPGDRQRPGAVGRRKVEDEPQAQQQRRESRSRSGSTGCACRAPAGLRSSVPPSVAATRRHRRHILLCLVESRHRPDGTKRPPAEIGPQSFRDERGSSASRRPSPTKLTARTRQRDQDAGRAARTTGAGAGHRRSRASMIMFPRLGLGRLDAEAEEREAGLEQDRVRDAERRDDGQRPDDVRQQVAAEDRPVAHADHARGRDELRFAQRQDLAANDAGQSPASPAGR